MLLLAVQDRTESKICDMSLVKHDEGINSDNVVSSTYLCDSQGARRSSIMTINDRGPRREPCGKLPFKDFQEETWRLTLTRCRRHVKYDPNRCKRQFGMLNDFSLVIKMLWSTRSKAFLKSIKRLRTEPPLSSGGLVDGLIQQSGKWYVEHLGSVYMCTDNSEWMSNFLTTRQHITGHSVS